MEFVSKSKIKLSREISDLDSFAFDFLKILEKYSNYVIIGGYVSILLGRSRASEDIDVIIPKLELTKFIVLCENLYKNGFYCLNTDDFKEIYDYLINHVSVRFARKDTIIPNMEVKFAKTKFDKIALNNPIEIHVKNKKIIIACLELQIAFKEIVLRSPKDIEDARHIRNVAGEYLDKNLIKKYSEDLYEFYFGK